MTKDNPQEGEEEVAPDSENKRPVKKAMPFGKHFQSRGITKEGSVRGK
jgi:hypothetical protein